MLQIKVTLIFLEVTDHEVGIEDRSGWARHHKGLKLAVSEPLAREELVKGFWVRNQIPPMGGIEKYEFLLNWRFFSDIFFRLSQS